jgi:hypothetical protein
MAITVPGLYGPTLEKIFIDTAGESLEAEDNKVLLVTDSYTPNFDTHDFRDDITNEIGSGGGYTTGGNAITGTEVTFTSSVLTFDATDVAWSSSTITNAMGAVGYFNVGSSATDQLVWLSDFVTAVSTTGGTLTIVWHASGIFTLDYY